MSRARFWVVADECANWRAGTQNAIVEIPEPHRPVAVGDGGGGESDPDRSSPGGSDPHQGGAVGQRAEQIIHAVGTIHQMNEQIARAAQESRAEWRTRSIAASATFAM